MNNQPRLWLGTCLLGALVAAAVSGCSRTSDTEQGSTPEQFYVSSEQFWATGSQVFTWSTPAIQARVAVESRGFHHGGFRVLVRDGAGSIVFDRAYNVWDDAYVIGGDGYYDLAFTRSGAPGDWTIRIDYVEFSGALNLTLRDTQSLAAEFPIAPPGRPVPILDPTFGVAGVASSSVDQGASGKVVLDSQGRLVVSGATYDSNGQRRATLWRYTATGDLDPTFAVGGRFVLGGAQSTGLRGLDVDATDRPVACGWTLNGAGQLDLFVLRLTASGALDTSFGSGGRLTWDDGVDEVAVGLDHDASGRILVGGTRRLLDNSEGAALALRFLADGTRDLTFGVAGVVRTVNRTDRGRDLAVDASGRPLLLGERNGDLILWRYTTAGATDATFGAGGVSTDNSPTTEDRIPQRLAISASDGSLAATGYRRTGTVGSGARDLVVWRFDADGGIQTGFNNGVAIVDHLGSSGDSAGLDLAIDAQGRVIVLGVTRTVGADPPDASATVWRFVPVGQPDVVVGPAGLYRFDVRDGATVTGASGCALDASGRVVAAGAAANALSLQVDPVVWRFTLP